MYLKIQPIFTSIANATKKIPIFFQTSKATTPKSFNDGISKTASDAISAQAIAVISKSSGIKKINPQDVVRIHEDNMDFVVSLLKDNHKLRMQKYGQDLSVPIEKASKAKVKAVHDVQYESKNYTSIQKKLATLEPLTKEESKNLSFILSQMEPAKEQMTLWRSFYPYQNFNEQLNKGVIEFPFLVSTSRYYNDFYSFWCASPNPKHVGNKYILEEPVFLKISVPKGKKILECNVKGTRMPNEVCLPPGKAIIKGYDKQANLIEVDYI